MNSRTVKNRPSGKQTELKESRSARFNVAVRHPSKWSLLLERLLASPMRIHRYRHMSVRMLEDTFDQIDCGTCK
jgi:hypothetical protein